MYHSKNVEKCMLITHHIDIFKRKRDLGFIMQIGRRVSACRKKHERERHWKVGIVRFFIHVKNHSPDILRYVGYDAGLPLGYEFNLKEFEA